MKEIISKNNLQDMITKAVDLLCDTVKSTLGPTGNNVLINNSETSPFITNDGVTIAKNIENSDPRINCILEIIKESSLKTDELVGDGTTTTLVLLQSIYHHGLKEIKNGKNAQELKKELKNSLNKIIQEIKKKSIIPKKEDLTYIAEVSSNSQEIGNIVSLVYSKMHNKYAINLAESKNEQTHYEIKKGYSIEIDEISSMYFQKDKEINLDNSSILILKGYLSSLEQISDIINSTIINNQNIIILVEDLAESIKQELLAYYLIKKHNIFIIKLPEYASRREKIELDISYLADCSIKNIDYEPAYYEDLGKVTKVLINKNEIIISTDISKTKELVKKLKSELEETNNSYERDFLENRISKLEEGIATIYVGGITKTEIKEKLMRFEDCLCALSLTNEGISIGGGITFLEISQNIDIQTNADKIFKQALSEPFNQMLENSGCQNNELKQLVIDNNYQKLINFKTLELEDINKTKILEPTKVLITALKNATSISSLLLSINYLVIDENNVLDKNNYL